MTKDKSLFHYGSTYNKLIDPMNKQSRDKIVEFVPAGASVLDIGCGTGVLCFELREVKQCPVVGVDLSLRMIEFARRNNPYQDVQFLHQDATNLRDIEADSFDYVVGSLIIHELNAQGQRQLVKEAWRVGRKSILVDSSAPLPWNVVGAMKRVLEVAFGFDHYPQFRSYLSSGGIMGILRVADLDNTIVHRELYSMGSNQIVVIAH